MRRKAPASILQKANFVLRAILVFILLIFLRVWHLSYTEHESRLKLAVKPQRREVLEPAKRGIVCDRFNIPLAVNKTEYQAAVSYAAIRQIPLSFYEKSADGKTVKRSLRKLYIRKLSEQLAQVLNLDTDRIEDLIHSKASLYNHVPYVLKNDLAEQEYFRLKMLEKDWPGVQAILRSKRYYPQGKLASDVIGYMGSINRGEYEAVLHEVRRLSEALEAKTRGSEELPPDGYRNWEEVEAKLVDLKEKAYSINDMIGKSGVEAALEHELRGYHGKKLFYTDAKGNFLRELPGSRKAVAGERKILTLSAELQKHAEVLLAEHEKRRGQEQKLPWICGGAIVAMDPNNGEMLALASYPRFDPNDFIVSGSSEEVERKKRRIRHWFEQESSIGAIWDGQEELILEEVGSEGEIQERLVTLDWEQFMRYNFSQESFFYSLLTQQWTVAEAVHLQASAKQMLEFLGQKDLLQVLNFLYSSSYSPSFGKKMGAIAKAQIEKKIADQKEEYERVKKALDQHLLSIPSNYDKMLLIDLSRLLVNGENISEELLQEVAEMQVGRFRELERAFHSVKEFVQKEAFALFEKNTFKEWRKECEQTFLQQKRKEEKEANSWAKPYIDHLDSEKKRLFHQFWQRHKWQFLTSFLFGKWQKPHPQEKVGGYLSHFAQLHNLALEGYFQKRRWHEGFFLLQKELENRSLNISLQFIQAMRSFKDLQRPLLGTYKGLRAYGGIQTEKSLAMSFYPVSGMGYARSLAFRHAATQGSIFKLVTAYAALKQQFEKLQGKSVDFDALNPLSIHDHYRKSDKEEFLGVFAGGKPIPRYYKGGRMPRSLSRHLGELDILGAIERSSNPYFALLAGDILSTPEQLVVAAKEFSFGNKTGIALPYEISGKVPNDVDIDKTGLYAFSIGQHTLTVTPLQTAVMLSAIANKGAVFKPKLTLFSYGQKPLYGKRIFQTPFYPYQEALKKAGIHYPLFTKLIFEDQSYRISMQASEVVRTLFFPDEVHKILVQGMGRVVRRLHSNSLPALRAVFKDAPDLVSAFDNTAAHLAGKTSTAEVKERVGLEGEKSLNVYNDVWFGGIAYKEPLPKNLQATTYPEPELVVVVYLRYGTYGRDAVPIACSIVEKWRQIQKREGLAQ